MLTLTRKPEQKIYIGEKNIEEGACGDRLIIGDKIEIVVKEIRRNQVRLGIVAPANMIILREELITRTDDKSVSSSSKPENEK